MHRGLPLPVLCCTIGRVIPIVIDRHPHALFAPHCLVCLPYLLFVILVHFIPTVICVVVTRVVVVSRLQSSQYHKKMYNN